VKSYLIQFKAFTGRVECEGGKKGGLKMKPSLAMLLKTHVEKMSHFGLTTISMKLKGLFRPCHDVYEKTGA
jgi:hypothetical protein